MSYKDVIARMKCDSFEQAKTLAVPVLNEKKEEVGSLVPVGDWILHDRKKIESICAWRQRIMKMFLTQFQSTPERTFLYLKNLSIGQGGRLFFLLYDCSQHLIGHIGISDVDSESGELDNLVRGVKGGDPRLVYFAEAALLNWCFKRIRIQYSTVRVLSYNWLVIGLHEEIGFCEVVRFPLLKYEDNGIVYHNAVNISEANVNYSCVKMKLTNKIFYENNFYNK